MRTRCVLRHVHLFLGFEQVGQDLLAGLIHTQQGNHIASQHRKKQSFLGSRLAGYVFSALHSPVHFIKSMTPVERHAELVYAESLFEKVTRPYIVCTLLISFHSPYLASSTRATG